MMVSTMKHSEIEMSDNDLIRRGDALAELPKHANGITILGGQSYRSMTLEVALEAIAALPADPVRVTIKPLVWEDPCAANNWIHVARSVFGEYFVGIDGGKHSAWLEANVKPHENKIGDDVGSVYEAKKLAEADYQKRFHKADLVTAINTQPDPRDAVIARLVEAAEKADGYDQDCGCNSCMGITLAIAAAKGGAA